jgi:hypothetical protein
MEAVPKTPSVLMLRFAFPHFSMSLITYISGSEILLACITEEKCACDMSCSSSWSNVRGHACVCNHKIQRWPVVLLFRSFLSLAEVKASVYEQKNLCIAVNGKLKAWVLEWEQCFTLRPPGPHHLLELMLNCMSPLLTIVLTITLPLAVTEPVKGAANLEMNSRLA